MKQSVNLVKILPNSNLKAQWEKLFGFSGIIIIFFPSDNISYGEIAHIAYALSHKY